MKKFKSTGIGSNKKQAVPLTCKDVKLLWEKNFLGDSTPQSLLDTCFFNGLCFALWSGKEHCQLRHHPAQIKIVENPGKHPHLIYTEDQSKNRPGGSSQGRKQKPKIVVHRVNLQQPNHCFVRLFKVYNGLYPKDRVTDSLYLQPLPKPRADCWYSKQPYGHNWLAGTVAHLCKNAGIPEYETNHSVRATNAAWLFDCDVNEQLIMERIGHFSCEGVRSYKRTSKAQCEKLSDILNNCSKKPCYFAKPRVFLIVLWLFC